METNQVNVMPRIGDPAPAFTAKTTQGVINFPTDYKGKWKILFSHPADFTPVCTSEFMTFATMADEFEGGRTVQPHRLATHHPGQNRIQRHEKRGCQIPAY